jgi:acyl-CoA thioester hydrolase
MYSFPVFVEYEDVDSYNIVHHPKILYYFERTRVHFFNDNGIDLNKLKYGIVIRNLNIQYKSQLIMLDRIVVELGTKNFGKFSFTFDYTVRRDGKITTRGEIEMVTIDLESKKMTAIPDEMRVILEKIKTDE